MKRFAVLTTVLAAVLTLVLPFIGGGGHSLAYSISQASASEAGVPIFASSVVVTSARTDASTAAFPVSKAVLASRQARTAAYLKSDTEHLGQKPVPVPAPVVVPVQTASGGKGGGGGSTAQRRSAAVAAGVSCPGGGGGGGSAPGGSESGIGGTTSGDIQSFSATYNAIRVANCLEPVPAGNFRFDSCMEQRLYWMAEDPSENPGNTWGHTGVRSLAPDASGAYYSDTVAARGCDGNLAGGSGNSGATVAQKWWDSLAHRASLYRPTFSGSTGGVCIYFAMTHGGLPSDGAGFARAAARWGGC